MVLFLILNFSPTGAPYAAAAVLPEVEAPAIASAWARPGLAGATSAVYFTLLNPSDEPLTLVGAETEAAQAVELHETRIVEVPGPGNLATPVMRMDRVPTITVEPGGTVELSPGGLHIMLIGLSQSLAEGDELELRLVFEGRPPFPLTVPVRGGDGDGHHDHHHHHDHGHGHGG